MFRILVTIMKVNFSLFVTLKFIIVAKFYEFYKKSINN